MKQLQTDALGRPGLNEVKASAKNPVKVLLDNVRSGSNTGSIFRTCDAFAVEELILGGVTPVPPHREVLKTALGATQSVHWSHTESPLETVLKLKDAGYTVIAVEQTDKSEMLNQVEWPEKTLLILGNEVNGVSPELLEVCNRAVEIPQAGIKHSLNVAVAAGVVLWTVFNSFRLSPAP